MLSEEEQRRIAKELRDHRTHTSIEEFGKWYQALENEERTFILSLMLNDKGDSEDFRVK